MLQRHRLLTLLTGLLLVLPASGQAPRVRDLRPLCDSLTARLKRRTTVDFRVSVSSTEVRGNLIDLTFNNNLSYFPWHEADVAWFREQIAKEWKWKDWQPGRILTNHYELDELVTPTLRADGKPSDYARSTEDPRQTQPRFISQVGARRWLQGLNDRYIVLWQSHGRYYDESQDLWTWQRACLHRTVEDMYTQTYVLPFLIPMLENAGAYVMTPRERDTQVREIITDNDPAFGGPREGLLRRAGRYHEQGVWSSAGEGFADTKAVYTFSDHPFRAGTARQARCSGSEATATASWTPEITRRGRYAVYVSYKSLPSSTREAHYTVWHLGGQTEFTVNQKMGGGTWIYLGTFEFAEGTTGKVVLDNRGGSGFVVTADAVKKTQYLFMAPYIQSVSVFQRHAHDPYHAKEVVRMGVRYEDVVDTLFVQSRALQLCEDSVSAASVHEQSAAGPARNSEARVVASRAMGVARAEHRYLAVSFHAKSLW